MSKKLLYQLLAVVMLASMILTACGGATGCKDEAGKHYNSQQLIKQLLRHLLLLLNVRVIVSMLRLQGQNNYRSTMTLPCWEAHTCMRASVLRTASLHLTSF